MKRPSIALCYVALLSSVGCGNSTVSGDAICANHPSIGTATFSGSLTGTVNVGAVASWEPQAGFVFFSIGDFADVPQLTFDTEFKGQSLPTGTFTDPDFGLGNSATVVEDQRGAIWVDGAGASPDGGYGGHFILTITSVSQTAPGPGAAAAWNSHGTFSDDVVPDASGSGRYTPNTATADAIICATF